MVEVTYDSRKVNFKQLMELHLKNIDPFDGAGQFCDKGKVADQSFFTKPRKKI